MRVLLCHTTNGNYLQSRNCWVTNPAKAHNFERSQLAVKFAYEHALQEVEVLIEFEDPEYNVRLAVRPPSVTNYLCPATD